MKLLWSKQFTDDNPAESNYDGIFHEHNGEVRFFFKNWSGISMLTENMNAPQVIWNEKLPYSRWVLVDQKDHTYLFFDDNIYKEHLSEERAFDLRTLQMTHILPESALKDYRAAHKPKYYYEEASFEHGEYCISHKGQWGYECTKNGENLWQFRGYAYLYTDIYVCNDRVFFGTSGQGGYFYVLNLKTGEPLTKLRTGGTKHIIQIGDVCYVLQNGKNASIVCVDLRDGQIRQTLPLKGTAGYSAVIQQIGQQLHTITFNSKNGRMHSAYWSCIALD